MKIVEERDQIGANMSSNIGATYTPTPTFCSFLRKTKEKLT